MLVMVFHLSQSNLPVFRVLQIVMSKSPVRFFMPVMCSTLKVPQVHECENMSEPPLCIDSNFVPGPSPERFPAGRMKFSLAQIKHTVPWRLSTQKHFAKLLHWEAYASLCRLILVAGALRSISVSNFGHVIKSETLLKQFELVGIHL